MVKLLSWRPLHRSTLRGLCTVEFASGMRVMILPFTSRVPASGRNRPAGHGWTIPPADDKRKGEGAVFRGRWGHRGLTVALRPVDQTAGLDVGALPRRVGRQGDVAASLQAERGQRGLPNRSGHATSPPMFKAGNGTQPALRHARQPLLRCVPSGPPLFLLAHLEPELDRKIDRALRRLEKTLCSFHSVSPAALAPRVHNVHASGLVVESENGG